MRYIGNPATPEMSGNPPSAPRNLEATVNGFQVVLGWDAPASGGGSPVNAYRIYRGNLSGKEVFLAESGNILAFSDTVPSYGTYYYRVSAVNSDGEGALSNEAVASVVKPPETFTIRGKVTGSDGKALAGAAVKLDSTDGIYHDKTETGSSGEYTFTNVPIQKTYIITVNLTGYIPYRSNPVAGEPGKVIEKNIQSKLVGTPASIAIYVLIGSMALLGSTGLYAAFVISEAFRYAFLSSFFVPMYTRLRRERVLDHFVRGQVYDYIRNHPGTHYNALRGYLRLTNGTLTYHLRTLEMQGFIKSKREGMYRRYYEIGVRAEPGIGIRYSRLQYRILDTVGTAPGLSQTDLARKLELPLSVLNYNMKELKKVGAVRVEVVGKRQHCYANRTEEAPPAS
jgi:DNA-binding MarR family transcriptional regulator